jgi:hypothetical protein
MAKPRSTKTAPLSYGQLVKKIIGDPEFAKRVHDLVCAARGGDKAASNKLSALYKLTPADLKKCCLSASFVKTLDCGQKNHYVPYGTTPTTVMLLDFAAMV